LREGRDFPFTQCYPHLDTPTPSETPEGILNCVLSMTFLITLLLVENYVKRQQRYCISGSIKRQGLDEDRCDIELSEVKVMFEQSFSIV